jgi:hypothetical protein
LFGAADAAARALTAVGGAAVRGARAARRGARLSAGCRLSTAPDGTGAASRPTDSDVGSGVAAAAFTGLVAATSARGQGDENGNSCQKRNKLGFVAHGLPPLELRASDQCREG